MSEDLKLETAPTSKRFPTTNQAKACYMCATDPTRLRTRAATLRTFAWCFFLLSARACTWLLADRAPGHRRYYNSYHQCKYDYSEEEPQCAKLKGWAHSMCPDAWVRQKAQPHGAHGARTRAPLHHQPRALHGTNTPARPALPALLAGGLGRTSARRPLPPLLLPHPPAPRPSAVFGVGRAAGEGHVPWPCPWRGQGRGAPLSRARSRLRGHRTPCRAPRCLWTAGGGGLWRRAALLLDCIRPPTCFRPAGWGGVGEGEGGKVAATALGYWGWTEWGAYRSSVPYHGTGSGEWQAGRDLWSCTWTLPGSRLVASSSSAQLRGLPRLDTGPYSIILPL